MAQCIWPSIFSFKLINHLTLQFDRKLPHALLTLLLPIMSQLCELTLKIHLQLRDTHFGILFGFYRTKVQGSAEIFSYHFRA